MLTTKEIRQMSMKELAQEIIKVNRECKRLKLDILSGSSKETHQLKLLKRQKAQMNTIQTENMVEEKKTAPIVEKKIAKKASVKTLKKARKVTV